LWIYGWRLGWNNVQANRAGVAGRVFLSAFYTPFPISIRRIDHQLGVLGGAGTFLRFGLYANGGTLQAPLPDGGKLLIDTGDIVASSNLFKDIAINPTNIPTGWFFLCLETGDATINYIGTGGNSTIVNQGGEQLRGCFYDRVGGYGPLIDPCPVTTALDTANLVALLRYVQSS